MERSHAAASATRSITVEDGLALRIANDPQIAPDGSRVVCAVTVVDVAANGYQSHLWVAPVSGDAPWQLTTAAARDAGPRWSPDGGCVAFLSDRGGPKQLWVIAAGGGEARPLTSGALSPSEFAWAPDGRSIAFVGKPEAAPSDEASDVRVISRLHYKQDGEGIWDGRWKQVFVVDADGGGLRQVTQGDYDHINPAWSPDGALLAYAGDASPDADLAGAGDIWVVPVGGAAPPRPLTRCAGPALLPCWSPDGTHVAYVGHDNVYWGASHLRVWVVPATGGESRCLSRGHDRSVEHHIGSDVRANASTGGLTWSPDGGRIYFMTADGGSTQIASVAVADGAVRLETTGDHDVVGCSLDRAGRRLACVEGDPRTPGEVAVAELGDPAPRALRRLTRWNGAVLDALALAVPERFECTGADGWPVEGWVMKPAGTVAGDRIPTVLEIHGGPHSAYGYAFMHQFQLLCAAGYGVVYANPRGSQGYGEAFCAATHHDWGGKDYEDLMRVVDHTVGAHAWIDPDRLGVAGGSYGGYMTNWIVGHTQRFRAAVTMRTTCDRYAQWGTSDIAYHNGRWEFPGDPWDAAEFYRERSPITYVRQMKTPMLILHGENDLRCPIAQSEQLFTALMKLGTPALFVRFPGESHGMSASGQPRHRVAQLRHILAWLDRYLRPAQPARNAVGASAPSSSNKRT
ncbi:MAG TPA: S9 family peptidase [bacterium]|nr:S9 family peptidase [bacterium]